MANKFKLASTPHIEFGSGKIKKLPSLLENYGSKILLITGKTSFIQSDHWDKLLLQFEAAKIHWSHHIIDKEPTPEMIDDCVKHYKQDEFEVVVAVGGGSVLDAGKAISAMLCEDGLVKDFLEGVGTRPPAGDKVPFIAIPTTSGTGSEATKNAVISEVGPEGFKKSLRHDNYVPDLAIVDPELIISCPGDITAQSGMDAFTQLLESYLSTNANPVTDALAVDGIRRIRDGLEKAVLDGSDLEAREQVAYAALLSGITLANAGLGTIHGFASSIGGFFEIPHGLVCAKMMLPVNKITIGKLREKGKSPHSLSKYARIGKLFSKEKDKTDDDYISLLLEIIEKWTNDFQLRSLGDFGIKEKDFKRIIAATGNKYNPVQLTDQDLKLALESAL
jgi:alcohol dehydrogenase class IV